MIVKGAHVIVVLGRFKGSFARVTLVGMRGNDTGAQFCEIEFQTLVDNLGDDDPGVLRAMLTKRNAMVSCTRLRALTGT